MSRRHRAETREIEPDPIYQSLEIAKFINHIMVEGKKSIARNIVYKALDQFGKKINSKNVLDDFERALGNAKPTLEVKSRRIGGATYQVPIEINARRQTSLAMKWIILNAQTKKSKSMIDGLASELYECFHNQGATIKKKDETHRMAEANKAFAHYKW